MTFGIGLPEVSVGLILFVVIQYLASLWISERLKTSLQKEHSQFLENLKWDIKVREQAVRVAEYLALATKLKEDSPDTDYRKANQLSWELAMWLPEDIYKALAISVTSPNKTTNALSIVVSVRKLLLKQEAGNLTLENIIHHAPGIGKGRGTNV